MNLSGENVCDDEVVLEKTKIVRMIKRIYALERENTKTKKLGVKEIKIAIEQIIEEEARKCY